MLCVLIKQPLGTFLRGGEGKLAPTAFFRERARGFSDCSDCVGHCDTQFLIYDVLIPKLLAKVLIGTIVGVGTTYFLSLCISCLLEVILSNLS